MRICLVTPEYPPVTSYTGGIGTQFAALAPALARLGHEIHVVTLADRDGYLPEDRIRFHRVRRPELGRVWPLADPAWSFRVNRVLATLGWFDVVFAPEWGGHLWLYARRGRPSGQLVTNLTTSLQQILLISAEVPRSRGLRVQQLIQRRMERTQAERSDALIACTQAILDWARRLWEIESIASTVLPNMVDVQRVRQLGTGRPPPGFPGKGPIVAFSGRLELRKGADVLAEAMREVWADVPDAHLVLAGQDAHRREGMMSDYIRRAAGPNADRVHLLGALPPDRLFPTLAAADVVALPSRWENFAVAALETMALERPLVVTTGGGFSEFLREGRDALMVPPGDGYALAAALIRLFRDPQLRRSLGASAARRADLYDVQLVTTRYAEFFERVAAQARSGERSGPSSSGTGLGARHSSLQRPR